MASHDAIGVLRQPLKASGNAVERRTCTCLLRHRPSRNINDFSFRSICHGRFYTLAVKVRCSKTSHVPSATRKSTI